MEEEYITISNPEFNKIPLELLEMEPCIILTFCEYERVVFEFYSLN